jgi:DNA (cytosine-5)-methyltransferase 1
MLDLEPKLESRFFSNSDLHSAIISHGPQKNDTEIKPIICSFFAGAGFLDLGFERAGFEVGYVNECHAPFLDAYKYARSKQSLTHKAPHYFEGSIENCDAGLEFEALSAIVTEAKSVNRYVGFIGGPPCPDFSVAGKNKGQHGNNGVLSKTYIDLIIQHKPDFFIFENVKGLYRTAKHRAFFETIKSDLTQSGYFCTERLINALDYGAPQDRERIILFGVRNPKLNPHISVFNWANRLTHKPENYNNSDACVSELTVQHWFDKNDVTSHFNAEHQFKPRAGLAKFQTVAEGDDSRKSYKRLHRHRFSPTAAYGNNEVHIHPWLPRRISVSEALAIQSMPKEFVLPPHMTLTNMFKTIGNGVPFLAAYGIAKTVKDFLEGSMYAPDRQQFGKRHKSAAEKSMV